MKLYIMRHAQASFEAASDRERPITERGEEQTKKLLGKIKRNLTDVSLIWSSDLLRAKQTAGLVSSFLELPSEEQPFLSPDDEAHAVLEKLNKVLSPEDCLFIVSHQPLVGELVSLLLHGGVHQAHPYTTSEIIALEVDYLAPGTATLIEQYYPD